MKVFLATLLVIGLGVFGMCFNIIFRSKPFPNSDVGSNEEMQKRGIKCMNQVEKEMMEKERQNRKCSGNYTSACESCNFNENNK